MVLKSTNFELAPTGTPYPLTGGAAGFGEGRDDGSFVSDSTRPAAVADGTYCAKVSSGPSAGFTYRAWLWTGSVVHTRQYVYLTSYPTRAPALWQNYNGSTLVSSLKLNVDGTLGLASGSNSGTYTVSPIPLNALVRIEASYNHSAGTMSLDAYLAHSTSAITGVSLSLTGQSFPSSTLTDVDGGILGRAINFTYWTDAWAASDTARVGPIVITPTVTGVTPSVVAQASGGTVSAGTGGTLPITGVTALVLAQGGNRPVPPLPVSTSPSWPPDPYRQTIRAGGYSVAYTVDTTLGGVPVAGATGLQPTGGSITDTTKPGVRRVLNLTLAAEPGLFELLAPLGTQLTVTCTITYTNRTTQAIPMGVFDIDSSSFNVGNGEITLTAPDKWVRIQRARFIRPQQSNLRLLVVDQIAALVRGALGASELVQVSATSQAPVGAMTWEQDRDKAILDLAAGIGAWCYFDRNGVFTIADIPRVGSSADWLIDSSGSGVLIDLERKTSRVGAANVVVVSSSTSTATDKFNTQTVWDSNPASSTFAGLDPLNHPELAGPFGVVVDYFDTPLPLGDSGALNAGRTRLSRLAGLASQVSLGALPNPALDAFQVLGVLPPKERADIPRNIELHVADTVTHPLAVDGAQQIEGRSTRPDEITGGL